MTYGKAAGIGVGIALVMAFAGSGEKEPTTEEPDKNTYIIQAEDVQGLSDVAEKCTRDPAHLRIVWLALVDEYGEDFIANPGESVDVPEVEGVTVDCTPAAP